MSWLDDPLFWSFPVTAWAVSTFVFPVFAIPLTLLAWMDPPSLRHRRIQGDRGKPERWLLPGLGHWARNNVIMGMATLAAWPALRLSNVHDGPLPPWWQIAASVLFFVYLDDALYYVMHRSLHHPRLYKHVHAVHHRVTTPWAGSGLYMHPLEYVMTGALVLVGPILLGSHVVTLWIWVGLRQWIAAEGHCGYRIPFNPSHLVPGYSGNAFHDTHHAKFTGNYSGFLGYIDRWLGTNSKGFPSEH